MLDESHIISTWCQFWNFLSACHANGRRYPINVNKNKTFLVCSDATAFSWQTSLHSPFSFWFCFFFAVDWALNHDRISSNGEVETLSGSQRFSFLNTDENIFNQSCRAGCFFPFLIQARFGVGLTLGKRRKYSDFEMYLHRGMN